MTDGTVELTCALAEGDKGGTFIVLTARYASGVVEQVPIPVECWPDLCAQIERGLEALAAFRAGLAAGRSEAGGGGVH